MPSLIGFNVNVVLKYVISSIVSLIIVLIAVYVLYYVARILGSLATLEQHIHSNGIAFGAVSLLSFLLAVIGYVIAFVLFQPLLSKLKDVSNFSDLPAFLQLISTEFVGQAIVFLVVIFLLVIILLILMLRTYYNLYKSIHGFGVGKFILILIAYGIVSSILNTLYSGFVGLR